MSEDYYYISFVVSARNSNSWVPSAICIMGKHPLQWKTEAEEALTGIRHVLLSWQRISEKEYNEYAHKL
jgi:hypothetical protein